MSRRECHFDENGYYRWGVDTDKPLDYVIVFPAQEIPTGERKDEYGNSRYKLVDDKITLVPQEPTIEQIEEKRIQEVNRQIAEKTPDMLRRQLSWDEMLIEVQAIDDAIKEQINGTAKE